MRLETKASSAHEKGRLLGFSIQPRKLDWGQMKDEPKSAWDLDKQKKILVSVPPLVPLKGKTTC